MHEEMGSVRARLRAEQRGQLQGLGVVDFHAVPVTWRSELSLKLPLPKEKHKTVAVPKSLGAGSSCAGKLVQPRIPDSLMAPKNVLVLGL